MTEPILSVRDLSVTFDVPKKGAWPWTAPMKLHAVAEMNFDLMPGECLGVVGESGSGKSTLARAIVGTVPSSNGNIIFEGADLANMNPRERRVHRRDVQMIFQDPLAALNPRMTVGEIIAEPLVTHDPSVSRAERKKRVQELMARVGLLPNLINRYPHEFSGGQCQRIGIARALIMKPKLLICDEPVSALDVSVQAQVVNLLMELQKDMGLSMIFIAHDLSVVKHISDRIFVMYLGRGMETADARTLTRRPEHPYTQALISSVPIPDPKLEKLRKPALLEGELPSPLSPPSGCVFRTRCPKARPDCAVGRPPMLDLGNGHFAACPYHEPVDLLAAS
ncbi:MAG: ATP-binding cassette domain-containing protein [Loktanella sp.]|nr:ATP-binding cassette domain-containing protein [Loktanella sp.]